jgi:phage-related protein
MADKRLQDTDSQSYLLIISFLVYTMWIVETLNAVVDREVQELPTDLRARLSHIVRLIEVAGLSQLPPAYVKHLECKLWELRLSGSSGIGRAIYVTAVGKRVVIVRAFVKKTQKTPHGELALARERAKDVK